MIEELIEAGKLTEFMMNVAGKEPARPEAAGPVPARNVHVAGIVPAILGGGAPQSARERNKIPRAGEVNSTVARAGSSSASPVTFSDNDLPPGGNPDHDAIVMTALIVNYQVGSILIDTGSSVNINFKSVFEKLRLRNTRLEPTGGPLYGFSGERRETEGTLRL